MGLEIGEISVLEPDREDQLFFGLSARDIDFVLAMSISGIITPTSIEEEYWYNDSALHRPSITENADFRFIFATGLISAEDYGSLTGNLRPAPARFTWRHFVSADLVENADVDRLVADLEIECHRLGCRASDGDRRNDAVEVHLHLAERFVDLHLAFRQVRLAGAGVLELDPAGGGGASGIVGLVGVGDSGTAAPAACTTTMTVSGPPKG